MAEQKLVPVKVKPGMRGVYNNIVYGEDEAAGQFLSVPAVFLQKRERMCIATEGPNKGKTVHDGTYYEPASWFEPVEAPKDKKEKAAADDLA